MILNKGNKQGLYTGSYKFTNKLGELRFYSIKCVCQNGTLLNCSPSLYVVKIKFILCNQS